MWMDEERRKRKSRSADEEDSYTRRRWAREVRVDAKGCNGQADRRVDLGNDFARIISVLLLCRFCCFFGKSDSKINLLGGKIWSRHVIASRIVNHNRKVVFDHSWGRPLIG